MKTDVRLEIDEEYFEVILNNASDKNITFKQSLLEVIKLGCVVIINSKEDTEEIIEKYLLN